MKHALLAIAGILVFAGCSQEGPAFAEERLFAMGTWVDVHFEPPVNADPAALFARIEAMLRDFERDYYAWGDGELARLNLAIAESRPMSVSDGLAGLLEKAQRISAASDGAFDPGVGALVELWGFHSATATPARPAGDAIARHLASAPRIGRLEIGENAVVTSPVRLTIDLGGIAKGEGVDRILALLEAAGVDNALVNAGGDLRVAGNRGDRAWRVGIRSPRAEALLGWAELADGEAAFTSGDYERYVDTGDGRMHHILDPSTGRPATHTRAVTVIASEGAAADAAATALFVAGPDRWLDIAARLGVRAALRVDDSGEVEMTEAMRERLVRGEDARQDSTIGTSS